MTDRRELTASNPIVFDDGTMTQIFRQWVTIMGYQQPIVGSGSPEGVVDAPQYSVYLDESGSAGNIQYRKMLDKIGGDTKKGWVLT